jgi:error-prone DNA polymerase
VPLFQEQLMRIAMTAAGFTGGEAEDLRRAMGSKRSVERMQELEEKLHTGMRARGIVGEAAAQIVKGIQSFALYGFPESHAASFALLVYASAYLKAHHPAAFCAALLNNWPMGFYHPATLITDARRHGVRVLPIDVTRSEFKCTLESGALRLGLKYVAGMTEATAHRIVAARPFSTVSELLKRAQPSAAELLTLASVGALNPLGVKRRGALWQAAAMGRSGPLFTGADELLAECPLEDMTLFERIAADFRGSGVSCGPHVMTLVRDRLARRGIRRAADLAALPDGTRVEIAGSVIVRQRPGTAKGFFFVTLEDETGFSNAIVTPQRFAHHRSLLTNAGAMILGGILQNVDGVVSVKADRFAELELDTRTPSRDFH